MVVKTMKSQSTVFYILDKWEQKHGN